MKQYITITNSLSPCHQHQDSMPIFALNIFISLSYLSCYLHYIITIYASPESIREYLHYEEDYILRYSIEQISIFFHVHHTVITVKYLASAHTHWPLHVKVLSIKGMAKVIKRATQW
jgi:hypothetical protein